MMNARTGQSAGPYKKTTQGLIAGRGYTGNYTSGATVTSPLSGANSPDTSPGFMIPDTATKWVLDYQYTIASTTGAVANIRAALNKAKFRWQEIDVANLTIPAEGSSTAGMGSVLSGGNIYRFGGKSREKIRYNRRGSYKLDKCFRLKYGFLLFYKPRGTSARNTGKPQKLGFKERHMGNRVNCLC